jgi:hypothetical protein
MKNEASQARFPFTMEENQHVLVLQSLISSQRGLPLMRHLPVLFTPHRLLWLLTLVIIVKIVSTATLVILGRYREPRTSSFSRLAAITNKVMSPLIAVAAGLLLFSRGNEIAGWLFIAASVFTAAFAIYVVRLRNKGKFYGGADWLQRFLSPAQVKLVLLAFLAVLFILAIRMR